MVSNSFGTPWTIAHQSLLSMGFPRQEHWNVLPFPSPGDLPDPGIKPVSPELAGRFLTENLSHPYMETSINQAWGENWVSLGPGTLYCSAAVFAPGHTSPWAIKHKETVRVRAVAKSFPAPPPRGLWATRLLSPWNFPGKNTGVGCHFLLLGIFPSQGSTQGNPSSPTWAGGFFTPRATWEACKETIWDQKKYCMNVQLGQILDKWYKEAKKTNCHFWSKNRVLGAKAGYCPCSLHTIPSKGWTNHLSYSSSPTPRHTPPFPYVRSQLTPTQGAIKQENLFLVLSPSCCSRGPLRALPEFLVWLLVNFYKSGKVKNPDQHQNYPF